MKDLEKLMAKKKDEKDMDPMAKAAKMTMWQELRQTMMDMMHDGMADHTMKKVEIAAPDKGSLIDGLDKAKDMMGSDDGSDAEMSDGEDMMDDSHGDEASDEIAELGSESDEMSDQDIADLERLLAKAKAKKMSM